MAFFFVEILNCLQSSYKYCFLLLYAHEFPMPYHLSQHFHHPTKLSTYPAKLIQVSIYMSIWILESHLEPNFTPVFQFEVMHCFLVSDKPSRMCTES